jgi:hypothetical protein
VAPCAGAALYVDVKFVEAACVEQSGHQSIITTERYRSGLV